MIVKRIGGVAALGVAMLAGVALSAGPAQADFVETLTQVGSNVVATGSGTLDLTGLSAEGTQGFFSFINPNDGEAVFGAFGSTVDWGPFNVEPFGKLDQVSIASSGNGDIVGIQSVVNDVGVHSSALIVPQDYSSGGVLSASSIWDNATLSSLGVVPGTYVWRWGTGTDGSFTLDIVSPTPEPTTFALMASGLMGLAGLISVQRRRSKPTV